MRSVQIVADAFAIVEDSIVIAIVTKCSETQYGVYPIVPCKSIGVSQYISLRHALEEGMKLELT